VLRAPAYVMVRYIDIDSNQYIDINDVSKQSITGYDLSSLYVYTHPHIPAA